MIIVSKQTVIIRIINKLEVSLMHNDSNNLGYLLNKSTKMLKNKFNDKLKEFDLTLSQWSVLRDVYSQELSDKELKDISPASVAQRLYINRPTMSGIMDRLLKKGWIIATTNQNDRRSQIISLTEKSKNLMIELDELGDDVVELAVQGFTESEIMQLKAYLSRIIKNLL